MEEFPFNLREYILGLNLGRWEYMASLTHFNLDDLALLASGSEHDSDRRSVLSECSNTSAGEGISMARLRSAA